jgi:hypothetical protein
MPRSAAQHSARRSTRRVLSIDGLAFDFDDRSFVARGLSKYSYGHHRSWGTRRTCGGIDAVR